MTDSPLRLLSIREAAARMDTGRPTVRRLIRQGVLPAVDGRVPAVAVERLLAEGVWLYCACCPSARPLHG